MIRKRIAIVSSLGAFALWAGCALDESGILVGDAGEGGAGDELPAACATLDAACLGTLPSGWEPVSLSDSGCAVGFDAATLLVNPRANPGACACGACELVGAYNCAAPIAISGGNNCNDPTLVMVTPGTCTKAHAQHVQAHSIAAAGSVGCFAANDAGAGATGDPLGLCVPGCQADFCGSASRCVLADGVVPCPSGFQPFGQAGTSADPGCSACSCDASAPSCVGRVTVFGNMTCADAGQVSTYAVDTCNDNGSNYDSVMVALAASDAGACAAGNTSEGDASLVGTKTICCQ